MKHFRIAFALLIFVAFSSAAQTDRPFLRYHPGDTVHIFGENVNLREAPATSSAVVAQLKAGARVIILEELEPTLTIGQRTEHWYKVNILNKPQQGYVWGGLLACAAAQYGDVIFVLNKIEPTADDPKHATVRVIQKKEITCTLNLEEFSFGYSEIGSYKLSGHAEGNRGMTDYQAVVTFTSDLESDMCDVEGELVRQVLLWDGKALIPLPMIRGRDYFRFGTFYLEKYIFPADVGGHEGEILHCEETGNSEEENVIDVVEYTKSIRVRKLVKRGDTFLLPK